jgi:creatinine amidohydrolase
MQLGDAVWTDIRPLTQSADTTPPILAIPIGSCEQHGPHLPLDTDTRIASAIADRLAEQVPHVLVGPPIGVSASGEHRGFPGTLSIGTTVTEALLVELVRSADWCSGVVFVNGHGGNAAAVRNAVAILTTEGRRVLDWWPRLAGADAHAGRTETSLMMAIAPHVVRRDAMAPGNTVPIADLFSTLATVGVAAVSANGVLGDPTGASAEEGAAILDGLVADLVQRVEAWP